MLLWLEGWDHIATSDLPLLYTNPGGGSPGEVAAGAGRFGGNAFTPIAAQKALTVNMIDGVPAGIVMGFAIINPSGTIFQLYKDVSGTLTLLLSIVYQDSYFCVKDAGGNIIAQTPTGLVLPGVWNYLEVKIEGWGTGQTVVINVDGNAAGTGTGNTGAVTVDTFMYEWLSGAGSIDDNYFFDTSAGAQNDFAGVRQVATRFVSQNGRLNQFSSVGVAGGNYEAVQDPTPDYDTTTVSSDTPGAKEMYKFASPTADPTSVAGVQIDVLARQNGTLAASMYLGVGNGTTEIYQSEADSLDSGYEYYSEVLDKNPFTNEAWAPADVDTIQVVIEVPNNDGSSG